MEGHFRAAKKVDLRTLIHCSRKMPASTSKIDEDLRRRENWAARATGRATGAGRAARGEGRATGQAECESS
eukprot:6559100-Lingulodinium_polyedra.AAC.1